MYESNLIIKFGKNLFNFVCRAVAAFVSARPGHNEKTRGYDDQCRDLGSQGPLAKELTMRCNLYHTKLFRHCAEFKAVTDESLDLR